MTQFSGIGQNPSVPTAAPAAAVPSNGNVGTTTAHPCRNPNITTCFHLIALQMNKTEELLKMANQTLSTKEESPQGQNGEFYKFFVYSF